MKNPDKCNNGFNNKSYVSSFFAILFLFPYTLHSEAQTSRMAAILGGDYLAGKIHSNGSFVYKYDPIKNEEFSSYNILRHAGTVFSLLQVYGETQDKKLLAKAERAINFLLKQKSPCPKISDALCIAEDGKIKLGANALTILALTQYAKVTRSTKFNATAQSLGKYILKTQSEEGKFKLHTVNMDSGDSTGFSSMYYPGEALFALTKLHEMDGDQKWLEAAHRGALWIIEVRDREVPTAAIEHDHWLLYALNALHTDIPKSIYVAHARKLVDAIIAAQHINLHGVEADWNGGFYNPPRSTPTATRSEGLVSAILIFRRVNDKVYAEKAYQALQSAIDFQLRTQMTKERIVKLGATDNSLGGFTEGLQKTTIRIDYVQHNISSLLGYSSLVSPTPSIRIDR